MRATDSKKGPNTAGKGAINSFLALLSFALLNISIGAYADQYLQTRAYCEYNPQDLICSPSSSSNLQNLAYMASHTPYHQCKKRNMPSIINNSMYWRGNVSIYRSLKALSPPSLVVTAAGNEAPKPVSPLKNLASKQFGAIIVGSLSPSGHKSSFSQDGPEVTIMAPSDNKLTSADNSNRYRKFGGSSGSTALVSASLAGFEWLSGHRPTPDEAKILLKKTATPTPGGPMLNSYQLGMVGKVLKERCANLPENKNCFSSGIGSEICGDDQKAACFRANILNPSFLKSPQWTSDLHQAAGLEIHKPNTPPKSYEEAFPECFSAIPGRKCSKKEDVTRLTKTEPEPATCIKQKEALEELRKRASLSPYDNRLKEGLACVYKKSGFSKNSHSEINTALQLRKQDRGNQALNSCQEDSDCVLAPFCRPGIKSALEARYKKAQEALNQWERQQGRPLTPALPMPSFFPVSRATANLYHMNACQGQESCSVKYATRNTNSGQSSTIDPRKAYQNSVLYESKCIRTRGIAYGRCSLRKADTSDIPNPQAQNTCQTDADCALVPQGCCGCEQGGSSIAIPLANKAAYIARKNNRCREYECEGSNSCSGRAACRNSTCTVVAPSGGSAGPAEIGISFQKQKRGGSTGQR